MQWFVEAGACVLLPALSSPDYDLIADWGDRLERVQVKTSICFRGGRWELTTCTRGGNQSWNGVVKLLDAARCDVLFAHVGDGRRWCIPMSVVGGGSGILLGGPKYAAYEVDPGSPLPAKRTAEIDGQR
jgi:hypothetical protein